MFMKVKFIQKTKDNEIYWLVERGWLFWKEYLVYTKRHLPWFSSKLDIIVHNEVYPKDVLYYKTFISLDEAKEAVQQLINKERAAKEKVLKRLKFDY